MLLASVFCFLMYLNALESQLALDTFKMPIPDDTWVSFDSDGKRIHIGDIRTILNNRESGFESYLAEILKIRLERTLIKPVDGIVDNHNIAHVLVGLTCIGIETLGHIFHPEGEKSKPFVAVCSKLHQVFSRNLSKGFKKDLSEMWAKNDNIDSIKTLSYLMYRYLRNEIQHGFVAKGVYLSNDIKDLEVFNKNGIAYLKVNPKWFWLKFKDVFHELFNEVEKKDIYKSNIVKYMNSIVS